MFSLDIAKFHRKVWQQEDVEVRLGIGLPIANPFQVLMTFLVCPMLLCADSKLTSDSVLAVPSKRWCCCFKRLWGGDVVQLIERWTDTLLTHVRFPGAARDFSPRVNFQCRLSYGARTPPSAIASINISAHVKDPKHWQPYLCFNTRNNRTHC